MQAKAERPFSRKLSRPEWPSLTHRAHVFLFLCPLTLPSRPEDFLATIVIHLQRDPALERALLICA